MEKEEELKSKDRHIAELHTHIQEVTQVLVGVEGERDGLVGKVGEQEGVIERNRRMCDRIMWGCVNEVA